MAEFETVVNLGLEVDDGELRSARRAIEDGLGDVSVGAGGGAAARATDGGTGGGRMQRRMFRWARERTNMMSEVVTLLGDIEEKVGGGGGGGGGGGLLGSAGLVGFGSLLTGGGITGTLTAKASEILTITASKFKAGALMTIAAGKWAAGKLLTITQTAWKAGKIIAITASKWAASALITLGKATKFAASALLAGVTTGTAITVGAAALITLGATLTLDALELIDIGELIERDWDDVITLEGSVPFDIGKATRQAFEAETPQQAESAVSNLFQAGRGIPGFPSGLAPTQEQIDQIAVDRVDPTGGGANQRTGSTSPTVNSNATYEINGQTQEEILTEVEQMQEEERRRLERALSQGRTP